MEAWKPLSMGFKKRWWECVALPEDIDSSEEDSFRQQMRDLAFVVIMQQIIYFMGHYELFIFY
jgi:hypothetical protein